MKKNLFIGMGITAIVIILFIGTYFLISRPVSFQTEYTISPSYKDSTEELSITKYYANFLYGEKEYSVLIGNFTVISYDLRLNACPIKCGTLDTHNKCANDCMAGYINPESGPYNFFNGDDFVKENPRIKINGKFNIITKKLIDPKIDID